NNCYRVLSGRSPPACAGARNVAVRRDVMRRAFLTLLVVGCSGHTAPSGDDDTTTMPDANPGTVTDPCAVPVAIPTTGRSLDLMPPDRLALLASRAPCVPPGALRDVLESTRTLWYDKKSLIPGYQDSFGDNVETPIGFRPNTIDPELINLAVP